MQKLAQLTAYLEKSLQGVLPFAGSGCFAAPMCLMPTLAGLH